MARQRDAATEGWPVRARALLIGLALVWLSAAWIFTGEIARYSFPTFAAPFCHAVFLLLVLTSLNLALRRRRPAAALRPLELMVIYAMVSVASALLSGDTQQILITLLGYPTEYADSANRWQTIFNGALPPWLIVTDAGALAGFFHGADTFWTWPHVRAWLGPIVAWSLFVWAFFGAMFCVSVLVRRAWAEQERLTFPIVALPMALAQEPERFLRSRVMWIGFAIAGGITLLNGLAWLFPSLPALAIKRQTIQLISGGPLQDVSNVVVAFYFFAIALGFFMPFDLGASLFLFYAAYRLELAAAAQMGLSRESRAPWPESQAFGAYAAVFVAALVRLRSQLRSARRMSPGERREVRNAVAGLAVCGVGALGFLLAAGMRPWVAVLFLAIAMGAALMISRVRAEFGFPVHDMHQMGPTPTLVRLGGAGAFDRATLGMFALLHWTSRAYRGHPMPHQVEALRMAGSDIGHRRAMGWAVVIAMVAAVPVGFAVMLPGFYHLGASTAHVNVWGTGYAREAFSQNLQSWLRSPATPDPGDRLATAFGFAVAGLLGLLRSRVPGLPLHPLAYAVANSWGMLNLWMPLAIGTLCKGIILRWRGLAGYRVASLFFFGLLLGEFAVGCAWSLLGMALNLQTYEFWP